jgi:hypothetical protein
MAQTWSANTNEAGVPVLGRNFWTIGKLIYGAFVKERIVHTDDNQQLTVYEFACVQPPYLEVRVDQKGKVQPFNSSIGEVKKFDRFGVGSLTGFEMALQALAFKGFNGFMYKDYVGIKCIGERPSDDPRQSAMLEFAVKIQRADASELAPTAEVPKPQVIGGTDKPFDTAPMQQRTDEHIPF